MADVHSVNSGVLAAEITCPEAFDRTVLESRANLQKLMTVCLCRPDLTPSVLHIMHIVRISYFCIFSSLYSAAQYVEICILLCECFYELHKISITRCNDSRQSSGENNNL